MNNQRLPIAFLLLVAGLLLGGDAWSAQAGRVQFVNGEVLVTDAAGHMRAAQKGDAINEGDTLTSAKAASAQVKMQDGGFIAVRPDTQLKFDSFKFSGKEGEPENSFFSLFKGGFRAVTGLIGRVRKQDYRITTPVATIGIRGTDHETVMVLPDNPLVLAGGAAPGAYNKVNVGETSITTDRGTINVLPNQMGFAGGLDQMPHIQPINTNLFTVAPPPASGARMDSGKGGESEARNTAVVDTTAEAVAGSNTPSAAGPGNNTTLSNVTPPTVVINATAVLATATSTNTDIAYTFATNISLGPLDIGVGSPTNVSPMPNPSSLVFNYNCTGCVSSNTYTISGGTPVSFPVATTGAQWGYWTNSQLTWTQTYLGSTSTIPLTTPGVISWITAPAASPFYLPMVLQGTATYNLVGGTATDGTSVIALSPANSSAQLNVNFTQQLVNLSLNATLNGTTWIASGTGAPLMGNGQGAGQSTFIFVTSVCSSVVTCGALTVTANNSPALLGEVGGAVTGNGLTGAILSYYFQGSPTSLSGVAALGLSTPINTATPYVIAFSSFSPPSTVSYPYPTNSSFPYPVIQDTVNGDAMNAAAIQYDASGNPIAWTSGGGNSFLGLNGAQAVSISGATAMDTGTDPVSGIKWGRWSGGSFTFTPLAGGSSTIITNSPGGYHWVLTPAMSGPISLPVSGTYNYVLAGGTRPTDQLGNVGVLNSASLTANFAAMTVNLAASVTVPNVVTGGVTFNGSATGVPIQQGTFFEVGNNQTNLASLTCTGTGCGVANAGHAMGVFTQAGLGAAMSYGFQTGPTLGSPTTVVSGVAAFHR